MNKIVGVFRESCGESSCKYLKVVVSDKNGSLNLNTDNGEIQLEKGAIAIVPPLVPHSFTGDTKGVITLLIEQPLLALKDAITITDGVADGLRSAAEQAAYYFNTENGAIVLNALGELIVGFITLHGARAEKSPVVSMLLGDIERGAFDADYSIENVLKKLPLNYDYLRKLFKKETGLTPHEYLTSIRMERAGKILLSGMSNRYSALTIGQVAEACGYAEPLYFSRVFKKYFGVSPTEYAKNR